MSKRSITWETVAVSELRISDAEFLLQTAPKTSLLMQLSSPVTVELGVNGQYSRRTVRPGDFCVAPAGKAVPAARWRGERHVLTAEFSESLFNSVAKAHNLRSYELVYRQAVCDPQVSHLLLALREELLGSNPSGRVYADLTARAIAARLLQAHAAKTPPRARRGMARQPLGRVLEFIEANLDQDLGLRDLAAVAGLSQDYFARAFRESTRVPPHRYLLQRRLARARELLETSKESIASIAQSLGFTDQSHLTKTFRREMGLTPGQIRDNKRQKFN